MQRRNVVAEHGIVGGTVFLERLDELSYGPPAFRERIALVGSRIIFRLESHAKQNRVRFVDGHAPACRGNRSPGTLAIEIPAAAAAATHARHHEVMFPIIENAFVLGLAIGLVDKAALGLVESKFGLRVGDVGPCAAVREARMHRINAILYALQPVAILKALDGDVMNAFTNKKIVAWQQRRGLRPHIGKDKRSQFLRLVGYVLRDAFPKPSVAWFSGHFKNSAVGADNPAVIFATHAARRRRTET